MRDSSISYIHNRCSQGVGLHSYHIFIIGVVRGWASSISYIQNRHSQGVGLYPYHILIIGVIREGRGFIHIIYSE
jgi:hypothetical protein